MNEIQKMRGEISSRGVEKYDLGYFYFDAEDFGNSVLNHMKENNFIS